MIVGGQTKERATAIISYHAPFDQGLIARVFIRLLIYFMTEKIANALALICTAVQNKTVYDKLACSQPITMK